MRPNSVRAVILPISTELGSFEQHRPIHLHQSLERVSASPYPSIQTRGFDYVRRKVKLELGTLTDQQPTGRYQIHPLISMAFPALFSGCQCEVVALELERTFREKARFLADKAQCERVVDWKSRVFARAWPRYDLAQPGSEGGVRRWYYLYIELVLP